MLRRSPEPSMASPTRLPWEPVEHSSVFAASSLLRLGMLLLGMSIALDRFVPISAGPVTFVFAIGAIIGTLGWWIGVTEPPLRVFVRWLIPFLGMAAVSIVGTGDPKRLAEVGGTLVFFLLIPGFAVMAQEDRRFRALLLGLVLAAAALLSVVVFRLATGQPALDNGGRSIQFLGLNRNAVDITIVWLIPPVLLAQSLRWSRPVRLVFVAAAIVWLVNSNGRTGLVALLLVPVVMTLLKPSHGVSQTTRLLAVVGLGVALVLGLGNLQISWLPATQRIDQFQSGDRASADDIRSLLGRKAISLTKQHPLIGVGFGNFENQYDPVVETGRTAHIRESVLALPAHNTYYEVAATTGLPGVAFFVGMLLTPFALGWRYRDDPDVRSLMAGYAIVLFCITFHTSYGSVLCLPIALTLSAITRVRMRNELAESEFSE